MVNAIRGGHLARLLDQWRANRANGNGRRVPEYAALATAIRGLLRDGRIPLGVRLPAERELADALGISRTTVTAAYRDLRETGHLTSRRGSGSFTAIPGGQRVGSAGLWTPEDAGDMIDLGCAAPVAPAQFAEAVAEAANELPRYTAGAGYHPSGLPALRERIAAAFTGRGLPTSPDQILVTTGVQQAVDLILRLLVSPGQAVLVESPTYPNVLAALRAHRTRVVTSSVDPVDGWEEELLLAELRATRPTVAYLIPEFQNPTGHVMPHRLRSLLPSVAHRAGTDLIIDESFVELFLDEPTDAGAARPPVASFDAHARVLTVGGMSKPYWGGLRVGWIRAATPVIARLSALRVTVDMSGPVLDQLVAAAMLDRAGEVLAARRRELRERRDVLAGALRQQLPQWTFTPPRGGMGLWVELDAPVATALAQAAHEHGVRLAPGPLFGVAGTLERFIRLPFTLPGPDLVEAVRRLAGAHADLTRARPASWTPPSLVA
ncbi:MAG: PLP-dependent aminotransferase family protein [Micromonosporaceae bacterium]|nr:PLP-dependent aminotransferase family protein [Micromonosporaceae bacterium]